MPPAADAKMTGTEFMSPDMDTAAGDRLAPAAAHLQSAPWWLAAAAAAYHAAFIARASFRSGGLGFTLFDVAMISMRYARNLADGFGLCGIQVTRLDHDALRERLAAIHPHAPPHTGGGHGPPLIAVRDTLVQTT